MRAALAALLLLAALPLRAGEVRPCRYGRGGWGELEREACLEKCADVVRNGRRREPGVCAWGTESTPDSALPPEGPDPARDCRLGGGGWGPMKREQCREKCGTGSYRFDSSGERCAWGAETLRPDPARRACRLVNSAGVEWGFPREFGLPKELTSRDACLAGCRAARDPEDRQACLWGQQVLFDETGQDRRACRLAGRRALTRSDVPEDESALHAVHGGAASSPMATLAVGFLLTRAECAAAARREQADHGGELVWGGREGDVLPVAPGRLHRRALRCHSGQPLLGAYSAAAREVRPLWALSRGRVLPLDLEPGCASAPPSRWRVVFDRRTVGTFDGKALSGRAPKGFPFLAAVAPEGRSYGDPGEWKPLPVASLDAAALRALEEAYEREIGVVTSTGDARGRYRRRHDLKPGWLAARRAYRDAAGRRLVRVQVDPAVQSQSVMTQPEHREWLGASRWLGEAAPGRFVVLEDGLAPLPAHDQVFPAEMTLVDAGDFLGDGRSLLLFRRPYREADFEEMHHGDAAPREEYLLYGPDFALLAEPAAPVGL